MNVPQGKGTGADRWLISYADLMTLLFAFSMTLYAAAAENPVTSPAGRESSPSAAATQISTTVTAIPHSHHDEQLRQRLTRELAAAIGAGRLEVIRDARGLVVSMPDDAAFPVGSAEATQEARRLIAKVGETLRDAPNAIRIEGHTDNVPIRTSRYDSNWELSTARSAAVVAFLVKEAGLDAARLSAAGYGEFHPLNANDTEAHRARNRRVDLVILDTNAAP
jgi:chemotaxis protein MotB